MNFLEFIDKLPLEDRQFVIDHFVRNMLGQGPKEDIVIRRTAKISTLGTEEEIIKEISQAFNISVEQIKNQNIGAKLKEITANYHQTSSLINNYKSFLVSHNATKDKFEELQDLGKFLIAKKMDCTLETPNSVSAIPDFIITSENRKIGIEHTRLMNSNSQILIKTTTQILKKVENLLLQRKPDLKEIVNISINYWKLSIGSKNLTNKLSIQDKENIAKVIADYIEGLLSNQNISKPEFIDSISISNRSVHPLNIILNENYIAKPELEKLFTERIKDKEDKLSSYLQNKSLDSLWL
jgi:hypothetical protein